MGCGGENKIWIDLGGTDSSPTSTDNEMWKVLRTQLIRQSHRRAKGSEMEHNTQTTRKPTVSGHTDSRPNTCDRGQPLGHEAGAVAALPQ